MTHPLVGLETESKDYIKAIGMWCEDIMNGTDDTATAAEVTAKRQVLLDLGATEQAITVLQNVTMQEMSKRYADQLVEQLFKRKKR